MPTFGFIGWFGGFCRALPGPGSGSAVGRQLDLCPTLLVAGFLPLLLVGPPTPPPDWTPSPPSYAFHTHMGVLQAYHCHPRGGYHTPPLLGPLQQQPICCINQLYTHSFCIHIAQQSNSKCPGIVMALTAEVHVFISNTFMVWSDATLYRVKLQECGLIWELRVLNSEITSPLATATTTIANISIPICQQ